MIAATQGGHFESRIPFNVQGQAVQIG